MKRKREFFENLAIKHDVFSICDRKENYDNAVNNFKILNDYAAGPDRIELYCQNFTRRYKWFIEE